MEEKYYTKFREIYNRVTGKSREVYSPAILINGKELLISEGGEILEFNNKEDAIKEAKETYFRFKDKLENK